MQQQQPKQQQQQQTKQKQKQRQGQPKEDKSHPTVTAPAAFELPKPQLLVRQQQQKLSQTVIKSADVAAAAEAAATAAIQAARGLTPRTGVSAESWQQHGSTVGSSRGSVQQRPTEVAGITYDLPEGPKSSYRAAGEGLEEC
jgi:hypothetical protein